MKKKMLVIIIFFVATTFFVVTALPLGITIKDLRAEWLVTVFTIR